ncbi:MAG: hypothetical protein GX196_02205 [Clostridiaceae bacterium]|nr:hypothetical protein [Clostridiaceae bacterium]
MKKLTFDKIFALIFRVLLIVAFIGAYFAKIYINMFTAFLAFVLSFLPSAVTFKNTKLPRGFQLVILIFIFGSLFLGEISGFYYRFFWWDDMLHFMSGIILGAIGFLLVYALNEDERILFRLSPLFVALFTFTFSLACGAVWEIFEYFMDVNFGFNMQKTGLDDTMFDLIYDAISSFLISALGFFSLKKRRF